MTIYVFVIDNSASMAQTSYSGVTMLDYAKTFVNTFYSYKAKQQEHRFMAFSCDEYPGCVKAGWFEGGSALLENVRRLQPVGTCSLETAVGRAFWYLNNNRLNNDIPGFGWNTAKPEPAVVIVLTDSASLSPRFTPEKIKNASSDYFEEIYRPDQRAFGLIFRVPMKAPLTGILMEQSAGPLAEFCNTTGGKCYDIISARHINTAIENIHKKTAIIYYKMKFSYTGTELDGEGKNGNGDSNSKPDASNWRETFTGINKIKSITNWPIPESYWGDYNLQQIPQRASCPKVMFTFSPQPAPVVSDGNLFDRYEIEPSALSQFIIERNTGHYPIFVKGSGKKGQDYLCGYMVAEVKVPADEKLIAVLYVVPFNYPTLFPILNENQHRYGTREPISIMLRKKLVDYLHQVPVYYFITCKNEPQTLKKCIRALNLPEEEFARITYSNRLFGIITAWRNNIRRDYDMSVQAYRMQPPDEALKTVIKVDPQETTSDGASPMSFILEHKSPLKIKPSDIFIEAKFIARKNLLLSLAKLRVNYNLYGRDLDLHVFEGGLPGQKIKLHEAEDLHHRPIKHMGEYETYIRKQNEIGFSPHREVLPPAATSHAFGNPFKLDKKVNVDEVGEETTPDGSRASSPTAAESYKRNLRVKAKIDLSSFSLLRNRSDAYSETSSMPSTPRAFSPINDMEYESSAQMNGFDSHHKADIPAANGYVKAASPSPSLINGLTDLSIRKRSLSVDENNESSSECSSPAPKKIRELSGNATSQGMNSRELEKYKMQAQKICHHTPTVRPSDTLTELREICKDLAVKDQISVFLYAESALQRMKRFPHHSALQDYRKKLQHGI